MKIEGIHQITLPTPYKVGPVHVYLLEGEKLTLIDAGPDTDEAWSVLIGELEKKGFLYTDIEQIILTHHHPDHTGSIYRFANSAVIKGHWKNKFWLAQQTQFYENIISFFESYYKVSGLPETLIRKAHNDLLQYIKPEEPVDLDFELQEGDEIEGTEGWSVLETPGHAHSHIALYHQEAAALIGGDTLLAEISSNAITEAPYPGETDKSNEMLQYRDTLRRILSFSLSVVYPGHGSKITRVDSLINKRVQAQEKRADELYAQLKIKGPQTCYSICCDYFGALSSQQPSLTMSEIQGHLDLLEAWNKVEVTKVNSQNIYSVIDE
ncbi:MBL fold metallo-hydrolase [Alteribacillus sp. HJP-4]